MDDHSTKNIIEMRDRFNYGYIKLNFSLRLDMIKNKIQHKQKIISKSYRKSKKEVPVTAVLAIVNFVVSSRLRLARIFIFDRK